MPATTSVRPITSAYTCAGERSSTRTPRGRIFPYFAVSAPWIIQIGRKRVGTPNGTRHPRSGRRGGHAARPGGRPTRVRAALRPPRWRGVLARLPDGREAGAGGGRRAGGVPLDLA